MMYKKILLPTDGSENSKRAGKHAIWLADKSGADILVLYIVEFYYPQMSTIPNYREDLYNELTREGESLLESFREELELKQCNGLCKTVTLETKIKEGKPYIEILKSVEDDNVDLVVMGASGRHGLDRFMLGSVTERVIREAKCPVLVVH